MSKPKYAYVPLTASQLIKVGYFYFYAHKKVKMGTWSNWAGHKQMEIETQVFRRIDLNQYKKIKSK